MSAARPGHAPGTRVHVSVESCATVQACQNYGNDLMEENPTISIMMTGYNYF